MIYTVLSKYDSADFINEDDAINALWLLGAYHDIEVDKAMVKEMLDKNDYCNIFPPLFIIKGF